MEESIGFLERKQACHPLVVTPNPFFCDGVPDVLLRTKLLFSASPITGCLLLPNQNFLDNFIGSIIGTVS